MLHHYKLNKKSKKSLQRKNEYDQLHEAEREKVAATFGNPPFMKRRKWGEEPKDDMIESVEDDP